MNITVYTTATCPYCVMVKQWFDQNGVAYKDIRVDESQEAAVEMVRISGQMGVPFTTIEKDDGSVDKILGYNVPQLQAALVGVK